MIFRDHRLENGLEIIAECNDQAYSTAVAFLVRTGARDETDLLSGVSHFLEHMVFKGTRHRSADDVNRRLDELGAVANAYTSEEKTVYYAAVLPEFQSEITELLADIMRPALRDQDFELEKKVILEEIAKYEDQPPFGAHEKCMAAFFGKHPLGRNILGSTKSIQALTAAQMRKYFDVRYSPANIVLAAAGQVDFERLVDDARRYCGDWSQFACHRDTGPVEGTLANRIEQKASAVQQYVIQIASGPATADEDRYASRLLSTCVGDDSGSRFFWELTDKGLVEYAGLGTYEFQGTGIYMAYLCCAPADASPNLEIIDRVYHDVESDGVTHEELELAKNKVTSHIVLRAERPLNRLFAVGSSWLQRREYRTVREAVESYRNVTLANIRQVLDQYPLTRHAQFAIGPLAAL